MWVPTSSCPLRLYNRSEAAAILHGRHFVVAGNSVSRGLFSTFLNELAGYPSEESQDARQREKLSFSPFLVNGSYDEACQKKKKFYKDHFDWCVYNENHEDGLHTEEWELGVYRGKLTFVWLYDWFVPLLQRFLNEPNTIVTSNAGLNHAWAFSNGWDPNPLSVKENFPLLWNSTCAENSMLLYRQTTGT